jgi:hypothetical protein
MTTVPQYSPVFDVPHLGRRTGLRSPEEEMVVSGATDPAGKSAEVGKEFEAVFLNEAFEFILPKSEDGFYGSGTAGNIFRSMLAENVAKTIAKHGGIGIAKSVTAVGNRETAAGIV